MKTSALVLAGLLAAAPLSRAAVPASAKCEDAVASAARRLFDARYKAFAKCETAEATGKPVTCTASEPSIAGLLLRARNTALKVIEGACPPAVLATARVGAPCAAPADAAALADCLADQVSGPRSDDLLATAYDAVGAVADRAMFVCQKAASKAARKHASTRQKTRAHCAARLAAGDVDLFGVCPDAKATATLDRFRDKALAAVEKKCPLAFAPEPDADVDFGEPCEAFEIGSYARGPGGLNALAPSTRLARCMTAASTVAADAVSAVALPLPEATTLFPQGVASGDTTPVSVVVWTRAVGTGDVTLEVATNAVFSPGSLVHSGLYTPDFGRDQVVKVDVDGLTPGTQYYYRFLQDGQSSRIGRVRTALLPSDVRPISFAFTGDSNAFFKPFTVLDHAAQDDPDLFLYVGDTIYGDDARSGSGVASTVPEYHAKYRENREDAPLRNLLARSGTVAMWDDHEVDNDFYGLGWPDPAQIVAGNQAFRDYMPVREDGGDPQRLYRSFRWGQAAEFFVLDVRQYRSPQAYVTEPACLSGGEPVVLPSGACSTEIANPARAYLGPAQIAWLQGALLGSTATFKFIVNGPLISSLLFLPYDRWEGYAAERQVMLDFVNAAPIPNVIFLSTDIHAAIVNRVPNPGPSGGDVLELVAGAIGMDPIYRELPASILSIVGALPTIFPTVEYYDLDRWNYLHATVTPAEAVFTYRDAAGTVLHTVTIPAE